MRVSYAAASRLISVPIYDDGRCSRKARRFIPATKFRDDTLFIEPAKPLECLSRLSKPRERISRGSRNIQMEFRYELAVAFSLNRSLFIPLSPFVRNSLECICIRLILHAAIAAVISSEKLANYVRH